jgi:hypothetical protein
MLLRGKFLYYYIIFYAFALCLIPPVEFHGHSIFAAEWGLLPLFILLIFDLMRSFHNLSLPPKGLVVIWIAMGCAFLSGIWRGNLGSEISIYKMISTDEFHFARDGVKCLRWIVLFSTPWTVFNTFKRSQDSGDKLDVFKKYLRLFGLISASLGILEVYQLINLQTLGFHHEGLYWTGRLYGTFPSPLEASLFYGLILIFTVCEILNFSGRKNYKYYFLIASSVVFFCALILSEGGTAFAALIFTFCFYKMNSAKKPRQTLNWLLIFAFIMVVLFGALYFYSGESQAKINNFLVRFNTWIKWMKLIPSNPWVLVSGIGFSDIVADDSFFTILIKMGIFGFVTVMIWLKFLFKKVNLNTPIKLLIVFWIISWLTLDSIGFWGIGRAMWMILGLSWAGELTSNSKQIL